MTNSYDVDHGLSQCHPGALEPIELPKVAAQQFRKKPVVVQASQWFKNGDHPLDYSKTHDGLENGELRRFSPEERRANGWEGDIVRYYRHPDDSGERPCQHCGNTMHVHGWIDTKEGGHIVCPGDWIVTGVQGERYPCKPDIFAATYEAAAPGVSTVEKRRPARDWELTCHECDGSGHVYVKHQVAERKTDVQEFKEECECCEGRGFVFAFQDIPGIEEYVKACRPAPAGVSTVEGPWPVDGDHLPAVRARRIGQGADRQHQIGGHHRRVGECYAGAHVTAGHRRGRRAQHPDDG
ncbi:hypothetical protein [Achromobacter ruhlandii]|uniref:hypothetical protein n=1 Tax=Achromobacter ruhlandii TaxID=72557 RepID=UPI00234A66E9|nr:hypothetical protein [Achromobacter ruhlandii]MDC6087335.1 hypothetical protein [Achromobacter ruhlandii]MDC6153208.1 hypothetical protein [Achromobacter ruhlandii]WIW04795.1 hypothetical protein PPH40_009245 [Achromobacter ruhlandii]